MVMMMIINIAIIINVITAKCSELSLLYMLTYQMLPFPLAGKLPAILHLNTQDDNDLSCYAGAYYKIDTQAPFEQIHVCL